MKKRILFLLGMVCILSSCHAQAPPQKDSATPSSKITSLKVGDTVPDIVFHHMLNYKDTTAKLSDFKGKLVILDFWNTWCGACIEAFPKMDSLQKGFGDKVQIILVNAGGPKFDGEERVETTFKKLKERTGFSPDLPISILDTTLNEYFPHKSVPHEVWIGQNGRILSITTAREVTVQNIQTLIEGKVSDMEIKKEWKFNRKIPLLVDNNGNKYEDVVFRSLFTRYIKGIGSYAGKRLDSSSKIIGCYLINKTLETLIHTAYNKLFNEVNNRAVLHLKHPSLYNTRYCYDLSIMPTDGKNFDLRHYLREDLKQAFNIEAKQGQKKYECLVLEKPTKNISKFYTKYDKRSTSLNKRNKNKFMHRWSVNDIAHYFSTFLNIPIINKTGLNQKLDIEFPSHFDWSDKQALMDQLKKMFTLKKEERELKVAVVFNMKYIK